MDGSLARLMEVKAWGYSDMHNKIEMARPIPSDPYTALAALVALRDQCRNDGIAKLDKEWFFNDPTQEKYKKVALQFISTGYQDCLNAEADYHGICKMRNEQKKIAESQKTE
uniref:Uncharacterized protein n=1 Tax=Cryptomonas curvata TaxID=233186 RepID=A0A7S0LX77_9CRYP